MRVELVTSSPDLKGRPEEILPELACIGRSNCGKSSLINHILGRTKLARTSAKPGKTRLLNYYLVDDRYYLVDLPGYGYAKVSKEQRARWTILFRDFLGCQDRPLAVLHLLDSRHEPSKQDQEISRWIIESGHPLALAATKIDKVAASKRHDHYRRIVAALDIPATTPFFATSAAAGKGRAEILAWIEALLDGNEA